jgi:glycine/serine hydroxymethyltransferase
MSATASAPALISEEVFETIVDSQQSKLTKGVKRRLQRQRAVALLKSAAVRAEEQAARCLQDQRETEEQLRQLDSQLRHSKTESHSFSVAAKRYKQDKQAAQTKARELAAQISEKEALVTELQFQIQDIGGRRHKASLDRVSAFLGDPANVFAVPTARHGT